MQFSSEQNERYEALENDLYRLEQTLRFASQLMTAVCDEQLQRLPVPGLAAVDAGPAGTFFDWLSDHARDTRARFVEFKQEL